MRQNLPFKNNDFLNTIVDDIHEKKGKEVVCIDLSGLEYAICRFFVICHGDSPTQVRALADFLERDLSIKHNQNPWSVQGMENGLWVVMDYGDVFVHLFRSDVRTYYNLEDLWADGNVYRIKEQYNQMQAHE